MALLLALGPSLPSAHAAVTFPSDLFGIPKLADQIRSPIGLKLRDMRKAFGTQAHSANIVDFVGANGVKTSSVQYLRTLDAAKTKRLEETRIGAADDTALISESIVTEGVKLEYSDPAQRAYLDGSPDYGLLPNENLKMVTVRIGASEAIRFVSRRSTDLNTVRTEVFYGGATVLTVTDTLANNGTERSLEYFMPGNRYRVGGLGSYFTGSSSQPHTCRMVGVQSIIGADLRLSCDEKPLNTYAQFSQSLSDYVYTPLFANTIQPLIAQIVKDRFPTVVRPPNLATSGKMYTDILNILALLDSQRSNPNVLNAISTLRGYVSLIQDGTVEIKDSR